ncbi:MAG: hypothetical protein IJ721_04410 [Bacteroidales bacterium]|nr:hypothetical protein [Bacteroidales bacterium]
MEKQTLKPQAAYASPDCRLIALLGTSEILNASTPSPSADIQDFEEDDSTLKIF